LADLANIIGRVRSYLRDFPQKNIILSYAQESSDADIVDAIQRTIDMFNMTPPYTSVFTVETFPNDSLLVIGAVIEVLKSAQIGYARNRLPFSDAGISVNFDEQTALYNQLIQTLEPGYEAMKSNFKAALNLESAYGILSRWDYNG